MLDIKLGGPSGRRKSISNCPYHLRKLIKDQGLHSQFGSKDHRVACETLVPERVLEYEKRSYRDTLDDIIVRYCEFSSN